MDSIGKILMVTNGLFAIWAVLLGDWAKATTHISIMILVVVLKINRRMETPNKEQNKDKWCFGCKKKIEDGQTYETYEDAYWHPYCAFMRSAGETLPTKEPKDLPSVGYKTIGAFQDATPPTDNKDWEEWLSLDLIDLHLDGIADGNGGPLIDNILEKIRTLLARQKKEIVEECIRTVNSQISTDEHGDEYLTPLDLAVVLENLQSLKN